MKINVKKFDMSKMKKDATVLLIGKRGSGKSTLLKDILFHMRDRLDFGLLFSATEEATNCLDGIIPKSCMYSDYSESAVAVMLQLQKMARKKGNAKNVFIISDDLGFDKKNLSSKVTKECYLNGRHSNLFYITCQQYCLDAPPAIRTNIDYVISFADNVYSNRERLWKNFFGVFASMSDFEAVYRRDSQ